MKEIRCCLGGVIYVIVQDVYFAIEMCILLCHIAFSYFVTVFIMLYFALFCKKKHTIITQPDNVIDFDNAKVIDIGNFHSRLTLESCHTAKDRNADNPKPLPRQYYSLNRENIVSPYCISQCTYIYVISSFI